MRHRTGLRNRSRTGRSTYSKRRKSVAADFYGQWERGRVVRPEVIAGHALAAPRPTHWMEAP